MDDGALLLDAIRPNPAERDPKLRYIDWCLENEVFVRARLQAAMVCEPRLTINGLDTSSNVQRIERGRRALFEAVREYAACRAWCAARRRYVCIRYIHDDLAWLRIVARELRDYVSPRRRPATASEGGRPWWRTGPLIAAALDAGFRVAAEPNGRAALDIGNQFRTRNTEDTTFDCDDWEDDGF